MSVRRSVCRLVCLSHARHSVKTFTHVLKLFSPLGSHTILVFPHQTAWQYQNGNLPNGASNAKGYEQNRDFRPLSHFILGNDIT